MVLIGLGKYWSQYPITNLVWRVHVMTWWNWCDFWVITWGWKLCNTLWRAIRSFGGLLMKATPRRRGRVSVSFSLSKKSLSFFPLVVLPPSKILFWFLPLTFLFSKTIHSFLNSKLFLKSDPISQIRPKISNNKKN